MFDCPSRRKATPQELPLPAGEGRGEGPSHSRGGVEELDEQNSELARRELRHGHIAHGFQFRAYEKRAFPTTYYGEESGVGRAILHHPRRAAGPLRVSVVGLGVGTLAAYGRLRDSLRFYDIDPGVAGLSGPRADVFTYLRDCAARVEVVLGDGRLSLERELARGARQDFDVLAIDAFSSDAIPVHLLTREALDVYLARLARPDGILAIHISNRSLDLAPVVQGLAQARRLAASLIDTEKKDDTNWDLHLGTSRPRPKRPRPFRPAALINLEAHPQHPSLDRRLQQPLQRLEVTTAGPRSCPSHRRGGVHPRPRQRAVDSDVRRAGARPAPTKRKATAGLWSCPSHGKGGVHPHPRQRTVDDDRRRASPRVILRSKATPCHPEERSDEGSRSSNSQLTTHNSPHTFFSFHFPRRKIVTLTTASVEKAIAIAAKTPRGPIPVRRDSQYASGILNLDLRLFYA